MKLKDSWSLKRKLYLDSILKHREITLLTKVLTVRDTVFPVVMYGCESWSLKKVEHQKIDAFELWCWRRLMRVPWRARRSNQSILKEINPEYSLEGLMLKLQYSGHLVRRTDSLGKNLILERLKAVGEEGDRGWNCWMASLLTQWTWVWAGSWRWWRTGKPGVLHAVRGVTKSRTRLSDWTTMVLVNLKLVRQPLVLLAGGSLWALCSSSRQGLQGKASRRSNSLGVTGGICGQGWRGSFSSCCSGRVIHATQASAQTSHKVSWKEERQRTGLWGLPPSPAAQSWRAEISSLLTRLSFLGCKIESTLTGRGARRIEWDACGEKGELCLGKEVLPAKQRLQRGALGWPNSTLGWLRVDPLNSRTGCSAPEVGANEWRWPWNCPAPSVGRIFTVLQSSSSACWAPAVV